MWKDILKNVLYAAAALLLIVLCVGVFLRIVTRHNQEISVPDFSGMSVSKSSRIAANAGVRVDVIDSIYVKRFPKGAVVRQEPKPHQKVKKGRRVMLTINAVTPKKVPMPNVVGYSLRSANAEIVSRGLVLGRLIYVKDMATNNVLKQIYKNTEIAPGTMIASESRVDLVLGLSPEDNQTRIPVLYGEKYRTAVEVIHDNSLNVGKMIFDRDIRTYQDSLNAMVYRQVPDPHELSKVGRDVTLYLTLDGNKVPVYEEIDVTEGQIFTEED